MRRLFLTLAGCTLLGSGVVGCSRPAATCANYALEDGSDEAAEVASATVMLVDVADNSSTAAESVASAFEESIGTAVRDGGRLVARFAGGNGEGQRVRSAECFTSAEIYKVTSSNDDALRRKQLAATELLSGLLADNVQATAVGDSGSAVRLLVEAHEVVNELTAEGVAPEDISVVLYSDLLGVSDDCLNLDGVQAGAGVAEQLVSRCFAHEELVPLPDDVGLSLVGVGDRAETSAQTMLSGLMGPELCRRMSRTCDTQQ